jgi:hypothetical protein
VELREVVMGESPDVGGWLLPAGARSPEDDVVVRAVLERPVLHVTRQASFRR